jgi:two-component system sensor histidine kinase/response regulator
MADLPIIMMSSAGRRGDAAKCRQIGISAYLPKPVFQNDLVKAIRIVLGMAKNEPQKRILITQHAIREQEQKLRILVVEDNLINQKLAVKILEKQGYTATVAANGKEALNLLKKDRFDLVLMDVQMPVLDGLATTVEIRKKEKIDGGHIPIVAMTAHAMDGDRERFLGIGMDGYLSKPIDQQALFDVIEGIIYSHAKEIKHSYDVDIKNKRTHLKNRNKRAAIK